MAQTRPFIVVFSFFAISGLALAQDPPDKPTGEPSAQTAQQPPEQRGQQRPGVARPMHLSGKVIYNDGSPVDSMASVEMVCNGRVHRQTHTFNGFFSLELTSSNKMTVMDASVAGQDSQGNLSRPGGDPFGGGGNSAGGPSLSTRPSGAQQLNLLGCELRANQPGFQSETISLSIRRPLDNPDVGVIILHRAGSISGTSTSVASMAAPKKAKKAYQRAVKEIGKKKGSHEKAVSELQKAIELYPEFAAAWELLGEIRLGQKDESGAMQAFAAAVAVDPTYIRPNVAMMELEARKENWDEVSKWSSKLKELNPYLLPAHYYHGIAYVNLNRVEMAQESFQKVREAYKGDDFPYASYMLGYILAKKGEFESAASQLRHFVEINEKAPEVGQVKTHLAQWEKEGRIKGLERN